MKVNLKVIRIRVQKDSYKFGDPPRIAVDGVFGTAAEAEAEWISPKRLVIEGTVGSIKGDGNWRAILSPRSGLVVLTCEGIWPSTARSMATILREKVANYSLDPEWRGRRGFDLLEANSNERAVCATLDWARLNDIFHHWRDFGSVDVDIPDEWL